MIFTHNLTWLQYIHMNLWLSLQLDSVAQLVRKTILEQLEFSFLKF
jgi:hypothetical protein